jgi:predicted enzyme related to lactoylglutathione lyase
MEESMADLSKSSIAQIAIVVKDVEAATRFYRDALGFTFLFEFPGLAFFQCGDVRLMLSRAEKPEHDHPASILYFRVSDIEATREAMSARGVDFVDAPHVVHRDARHELWMTFFNDCEGNLFALTEERPPAV